MFTTHESVANDQSWWLTAGIIKTNLGPRNVRVEDDGWGNLYVAGHAFGPTHLLRHRSLDAAWEAWVDLLPTIETDDLPEAFGLYIMHHGSQHYLCSDHEHIGILTHVVGPRVAHRVVSSHLSHEEAMDACYECVREHELGLCEGYELQSNATGTGIVDMGPYAWMNSLADYNLMYPERPIVSVFSVDAG